MSVFVDCFLAILVWRIFSSLESPDYKKIRKIIREELQKVKSK